MLLDLLNEFDIDMLTHVEMGECKKKMMSKLQEEGLLKYIGNIYVRKDNKEICASYNMERTFYFVIVSDNDTSSTSL